MMPKLQSPGGALKLFCSNLQEYHELKAWANSNEKSTITKLNKQINSHQNRQDLRLPGWGVGRLTLILGRLFFNR